MYQKYPGFTNAPHLAYFTLKIYLWLQRILRGSNLESSLKSLENVWRINFDCLPRKNQNCSEGPQNQGYWQLIEKSLWKKNPLITVLLCTFCILLSPIAAIFNVTVSSQWFSKYHIIHEVPTCHRLKMACILKENESPRNDTTGFNSKTKFCLECMDKIIYMVSFWRGKAIWDLLFTLWRTVKKEESVQFVNDGLPHICEEDKLTSMANCKPWISGIQKYKF